MWTERQHIRAAALPLLAAALMLLPSSCGGDAPEPLPGDGKGKEVYIRASVAGSTPSGRGPYEQSAPSVDSPLDALVWASPATGSYAGASGLLSATKESKVLFLSGLPQLINGLLYPEDKKPLFFVAMHPESGWTAKDNIAYFTFTGSEDLLFAKETQGVYAQTEPLPELEFKHLLTLLTVRLKAADEEAAEAWGKLISMRVESLNEASIVLDGSDDPFYFGGSKIDFDFRDAGSDTVFPGDDDALPVDKAREAYVLCAPITVTPPSGAPDGTDVSDEKYVIVLQTENRTVRLPVEMTDIMTGSGTETFAGGSTMGHRFTLNLNLRLGYNITTEASVDKWVYGGSAYTTID